MLQPQYRLHFNRDDVWQMHRLHFHEDVEVLLSLSGNGSFFIEDEFYPLRRGSLFLFREATLHKSVVNDPYTRYVLHISPETLQEFSSRQSDLVAFTQKTSGRHKQLDNE